MTGNSSVVAVLRDRIRRIEGVGQAAGHPVLPLGMDPVDRVLPEGGLPLAGVHEIRGDGAATGFCAALLARMKAGDDRPALWLERGNDLYMPGLTRFGLKAGSVLTVSNISRDADMLWAIEEALGCGALSAVVGEIRAADFTASRRLQLAAEAGGVTCLLLGESGRGRMGTGGAATALSRWQVTSMPSLPDRSGVGWPCWRVALSRCRNGRPAAWTVAWGPKGWAAIPETPAQETLPFDFRTVG
ncbi:MAG: ImuA family protein [Sphingomonadales bacterium]